MILAPIAGTFLPASQDYVLPELIQGMKMERLGSDSPDSQIEPRLTES